MTKLDAKLAFDPQIVSGQRGVTQISTFGFDPFLCHVSQYKCVPKQMCPKQKNVSKFNLHVFHSPLALHQVSTLRNVGPARSEKPAGESSVRARLSKWKGLKKVAPSY